MLAAGATLFLAGPTVLAGCILPALAPPGPDPLEAPTRHAEADAALATGVAELAIHTDPVLTAAAQELATDRMAHAAALRGEIHRLEIHRVEPRRARPTPPAHPQPDLASAQSALTQATHAARNEAAALVMTLPGYRAALLASISACCATHIDDLGMQTYRDHRIPVERGMSPSRDVVRGLQGALASEHAAIWVYGVAGAFVTSAFAGRLVVALAAHQALRDATERMLIDAGARPVPPEPGYLTPQPVTDTASALRLVITAETDAAAAWRSVIERSTADPDLREAALDALTAAAVRATRWRAAIGGAPRTVPFPGAP